MNVSNGEAVIEAKYSLEINFINHTNKLALITKANCVCEIKKSVKKKNSRYVITVNQHDNCKTIIQTKHIL